MSKILSDYNSKKTQIKERLSVFKSLKEKDYYNEMLFCLLTPQSKAQKCWDAVQEINKLREFDEDKIREILKTRTRFHNNKTKYIIQSQETWPVIKKLLDNEEDKIKLRNFICDTVNGYGLKEAGHFLRNIGKSDNKIAILDRHILRNLKNLGVIEDDKIKNRKHYFEIEQKFLEFSKKQNVPIDELDMFFWSQENGTVFK